MDGKEASKLAWAAVETVKAVESGLEVERALFVLSATAFEATLSGSDTDSIHEVARAIST